MTSTLTRLFHGLAAGVALFLTSAAFAALPVVLGEPAAIPKARPAARLHLPAALALRSARQDAVLAPITSSEVAAAHAANSRPNAKRLVIGVVRPTSAGALPVAADLAWTPVDGGQGARMAVTSPGAAALRVSFALAGVPLGVQMVFFGSDGRLIGPIRVGDVADRTVAWWSPLTEGETQTVEFFVPGNVDAAALPLRAVAASHLFTGPSSAFQKTTQDIGKAGICNVDIACSTLASSPAFQDASGSVAQMVFNEDQSTILCTGTLLNDSDPASQVPYFLGANHCFENNQAPYKTAAQMQAVANTLDTLWFFQASSCGSSATSASYQELAGGATFLYNNPTQDALLLRLNDAPPAGAYYSGWDPNDIVIGISANAVHHPSGDWKKVTQGTVQGLASPGVAGGSEQFIQMRWNSGTTEPGSSGGALFTASGTQYLLRGALWGGFASCSTPTSPDYFSRFSQFYPAIAQYLGPAAAPAFDYTDLWWNPNESGWGLNLFQHPSYNIFGVWYTYDRDGTRTWFVLPGGKWDSSNEFSGTLYSTSGSAANGPFNSSNVATTAVGTGSLQFTDANHGTWTYTVNGISGSKAIERQLY